jgi:Protein of unknown function (DUF3788)
MTYGYFTDGGDRPDLRRAVEVLAEAKTHWDSLLLELRSYTKAEPTWRFYGRKHGWALAFKKGGRALAALFPDEGRLTVLVVLSGEQADAALANAALGPATRALIESLPRFKEGCWVFLPLTGGDDAADARSLIAVRAGATRRGG